MQSLRQGVVAYANRHLNRTLLGIRTTRNLVNPCPYLNPWVNTTCFLSTNTNTKTIRGENVDRKQEYVDPASILRGEDLEEQFVMGSGRGGQKVNTTRNNVVLKHIPTSMCNNNNNRKRFRSDRTLRRLCFLTLQTLWFLAIRRGVLNRIAKLLGENCRIAWMFITMAKNQS